MVGRQAVSEEGRQILVAKGWLTTTWGVSERNPACYDCRMTGCLIFDLETEERPAEPHFGKSTC